MVRAVFIAARRTPGGSPPIRLPHNLSFETFYAPARELGALLTGVAIMK
ncbi:MAG TPA: hypothetical protein VEC58_08585 [Roseiarcus sp.]|nr:hypothetical protein [Roseiarcus sp.]